MKRFKDLDPAEQLQHELARQNHLAQIAGPAHWRDTKIQETAGAHATDPFREVFKKDDWHRNLARTAGLDNSGELLRKFERAARKLEKSEKREASGRITAFDAHSYEKFLPSPKKLAREWLGELAIIVDTNGAARSSRFEVLKQYVAAFGAQAKFQELDRTVATDLIRNLLEAA